MINSDYIKNFIDILPTIFIYIVPGYICNVSFNYVLNKKNEDLNKNILENIVLSYIICSIISFILSFFYDTVMLNLINVTFSILCFSLILGFISAKFLQSKKYIWLRNKLNIKRTISSFILDDLNDRKNGTWVKLYLKNELLVYYGALVGYDVKEKYDDGFIILNFYTVYKYGNTSSELIESEFSNEEEENYFTAIKISEISRIEFIYDNNSEVLEKLLNNRQNKNTIINCSDQEHSAENNLDQTS